MSRPSIQNTKLNNFLTLSECHPDSECHQVNWWIYDERAGINIAMRAKTPEAAFVEAIEFWAKKAEKYEIAFNSLKSQVDTFVNQFVTSEPNEDC